MIIIKHRKSADVVLLRVDALQLDDRDLAGAYLRGAGMAGLSARRALLREANLRDADLRATDLSGADLSDAVLRNADLRDADLSAVVFADADLRGADLSRANLCGANLSRAQLFEANLTGVRCDAQTVWPVGEAWGGLAQPAVGSVEPVPQLSRDARSSSAWPWLLAQSGMQALGGGRSSRSRAAGLGAAALALALLVAAVADHRSDRRTRTVSRPAPSPRVVARAPISTPLVPPVKVAPPKPQAPATRPLVAQPRAAMPQAPQPVSPVRVTRSESKRPVRVARQAAPSRPSSEVTSSGGSSARVRAPHQLVTFNSPPARTRRPVTSAAIPVAQTPVEGPAVEPTRTPPVAAAPARPTSRPEPRSRKLAEAWGNREFHYGSGYDLYSMHLDRRPE